MAQTKLDTWADALKTRPPATRRPTNRALRMSPRPLSIAVAPYDRTLPLMAGLIPIDGVTPRFVTAPLEEIFARAFNEQAFDVTELFF